MVKSSNILYVKSLFVVIACIELFCKVVMLKKALHIFMQGF